MAKDDPNGRQGRRNQEMRDLRNRIHGLEVENETMRDKLAAAEAALDTVNAPPREALRTVCGLGVSGVLKLGGLSLLKDLGEVARWAELLDLANGKYIATSVFKARR